MLIVRSLKTKLLFFYILFIAVVFIIKVISLHYFELPQLYALEAQSDKKDINRIKMSFTSKSKELSVLNYDNAVWDDTHNFVDEKNQDYIDSNFVHDTYDSLGINGIHIYNKEHESIWHEAWNRTNWTPIQFKPFDLPSDFVKKTVLISKSQLEKNNLKPLTQSGYTMINQRLLLVSATSIFKTDLTGQSNGTMVLWLFLDDKILTELQNRAGISFSIEVISNNDEVKGDTDKHLSLSSYIENSYRTKSGEITDFIPFFTGNGGIKVSYIAPVRNFATSWLSFSTLLTVGLLLLALFVLLILFHFLIIQPILEADKSVSRIIKDNDHSLRFKSKRKDELGNLFTLIDRLLDNVESTTRELTTHNIKLQNISETDSLTKIPNRLALDTFMKHLLATSEKGLNVSLLICDVDFFKKYNDRYGHAKGDITLKIIAQTLQKNLHEDTDFVARYGGEEFVIVLKNTNSHNALSVANNLVNTIKNINIAHDKSEIANHVTVSIGIHSFEVSEQSHYMPYFEIADKALYDAKNQGRCRAILST